MSAWALAGPGFGLCVNLDKTVVVLHGMSQADFLAALGALGMNVPGLQFEAHGKYLGVRLGPESIDAPWEPALQKFVRRIHLIHGR
eukprot:2119185-Pyramimonas_sp.AAC.1